MGVADPERRPVLAFGNLEIRPDELQALAGGIRVGLTVREFQVLMVLARREDHVVRRTDIYDQVWGGTMKQRDRSVDVFVRKVRTKLARAAPDWTYIHTHFGIGYRFAAVALGEEMAAGEAVDRKMTAGGAVDREMTVDREGANGEVVADGETIEEPAASSALAEPGLAG